MQMLVGVPAAQGPARAGPIKCSDSSRPALRSDSPVSVVSSAYCEGVKPCGSFSSSQMMPWPRKWETAAVAKRANAVKTAVVGVSVMLSSEWV